MNLILLQIISWMKPIFCKWQGQLLGSHPLMSCLKVLIDADGLKFSGTNAQILGSKVEIDCKPNFLFLLCLRSRTWPLLRYNVPFKQAIYQF